LIPDQRTQPLIGSQRKSRGARAGFLSQAKVNAAHHLALLVEVFERRFHFAIQKHPAVDLDALPSVEILRLADWRHGAAQIPRHLVADGVSASDVPNFEMWLLKPIIKDGVGTLAGRG